MHRHRARRCSPRPFVMSCSREKTRRGWLARNQRRSNSFAVIRTPRFALRASLVACSSSTFPNESCSTVSSDGAERRRTRSYASGELARGERLRHVVVRPELEPDDPVGLLATCRQHDHRQLGARADPAAELEPVGPGQHHVEDDEVEDQTSRSRRAQPGSRPLRVVWCPSRADRAGSRDRTRPGGGTWRTILGRGPRGRRRPHLLHASRRLIRVGGASRRSARRTSRGRPRGRS